MVVAHGDGSEISESSERMGGDTPPSGSTSSVVLPAEHLAATKSGLPYPSATPLVSVPCSSEWQSGAIETGCPLWKVRQLGDAGLPVPVDQILQLLQGIEQQGAPMSARPVTLGSIPPTTVFTEKKSGQRIGTKFRHVRGSSMLSA